MQGNVSFEDVGLLISASLGTGYVVVVAGETLRPILLETNDGGESWKEVTVESDLLPSSICAVGDDCWLAGNLRIGGGQSVDFPGILLHSSDGGKSWRPIKFATDESVVKQVRFSDQARGWLVAGESLYRTEDAGNTWQRALSLHPSR